MSCTPKGFIGIDFGTSTSHFAYCMVEGALQPKTIRLGGKPSVTTCVLWKEPAQSESDIVAYGTKALETWIQYDSEKRKIRPLALGFKPDIAASESARRNAWAFLLRAQQEITKLQVLPDPIGPEGMAVVIGVPAEIGEAHKQLTATIARDAGLGGAVCVEEPLGALAYHLNSGEITPADARNGVVVVDFGGGTLDVALVNSSGLREPWGDPTLGGRLFDDLFFQWLCDQHRPLQLDSGEAMAVWQKECRELKENFSTHWESCDGDMTDFVGQVRVGAAFKSFSNASVAEFEKRARAYVPSQTLRSYLRGLDKKPEGFVDLAPIDLLQRIRDTLTRHNDIAKLRGQFSKVILTGGSSHWPFMKPMAADAFGVDVKDVLRSSEPETVIGSGLSLYYVLKLKNDARRNVIEGTRSSAVSKFNAALSKRLDGFADEAASAVVNEVVPRIDRIVMDWYKNGGSLAKVARKIDTLCSQFEDEEKQKRAAGGGILKAKWDSLETDLVRLLREHLAQFLADNNIVKDVSHYIPDDAKTLDGLVKGVVGRSDDIAKELGQIAEQLTNIAAAVTTTIIVAVKIKVIAAAVVVHPVLGLLTAATALVATLGFAGWAREAVERAVRDYEFGGASLAALKVALWESRLKSMLATERANARAELRNDIRTSLRQASESPDVASSTENRQQARSFEETVADHFNRFVDIVIQDLGVLEAIRAGDKVALASA